MSVAPKTAELAFALWERALLDYPVRHMRGLRPIAFEVSSAPKVVWSFDPRRQRRLFEPQDLPSAALRIRCSPDLLLRMFSKEPFVVDAADELSYTGDLDALDALAACIKAPEDVLSVRKRD